MYNLFLGMVVLLTLVATASADTLAHCPELKSLREKGNISRAYFEARRMYELLKEEFDTSIEKLIPLKVGPYIRDDVFTKDLSKSMDPESRKILKRDFARNATYRAAGQPEFRVVFNSNSEPGYMTCEHAATYEHTGRLTGMISERKVYFIPHPRTGLAAILCLRGGTINSTSKTATQDQFIEFFRDLPSETIAGMEALFAPYEVLAGAEQTATSDVPPKPSKDKEMRDPNGKPPMYLPGPQGNPRLERLCAEGNAGECAKLALSIKCLPGGLKRARQLYKSSCEAGAAYGCFGYGNFIERDGDLREAKEFYEKACSLDPKDGGFDACLHLENVNRDLETEEEMRSGFTKMCETGKRPGDCCLLGSHKFKFGERREGLQLLEDGCSAGDRHCCGFLDLIKKQNPEL